MKQIREFSIDCFFFWSKIWSFSPFCVSLWPRNLKLYEINISIHTPAAATSLNLTGES
jgi:hypothetical protein